MGFINFREIVIICFKDSRIIVRERIKDVISLRHSVK